MLNEERGDGPPSTTPLPAAVVAAARPRSVTAKAARRRWRPRPAAGRTRPWSRSQQADPRPDPPVPTPPNPPRGGPRADGAPPRWPPRRPGRASKKPAANERPPISASTAHASSTTTKTCPVPEPPAARARWAWSHAVAQAMSTPRAAELYRAERSRTTSGPERSRPGVVVPSNIPRRSPWTRRRSSNATSRPSSSSVARRVRMVAAASVVGSNMASTTAGKRRDTPGAAHSNEGQVDGDTLAGEQGPPQTGRRQRRKQLHLPTVGTDRSLLGRPLDRRSSTVRRWIDPPASAGIEGVEPDRAAGTEGNGRHAPGRGQGAVLALRIHHPGPATEDRLAPEVRLDERALPPSDLSEHDHVGVADHALRVELERVIDERAAEEIMTHQDPAVPQAALRHQGIGGPEIPRRDLVGRHPRPRSGTAQQPAGPHQPNRCRERNLTTGHVPGGACR